MSKSWLGKGNIIDKTQDHHKSEQEKMSNWNYEFKTRPFLDAVDDKIGFDLILMVLVFVGVAVFFLCN